MTTAELFLVTALLLQSIAWLVTDYVDQESR